MKGLTRFASTLLFAVALSGCAVGNNPRDPLENFNRAMFSFNDALDQNALKPAATVYRETLPSFVQAGVGNFFGNIGDIWTAVNNLLQGKAADGMSDFMRVAINSTFGILGLIDIGADAGLPKHKQDFGATLGVWGVGSGPYVVLPFLGPTTMRDTIALPVDYSGDLWSATTPVYVRNTGSVVRVVDKRAALLDASNLLEDAALDRYEFVRDAYLQRRASQIGVPSSGSRGQPEEWDKPEAAPPPLLPSSSLPQETTPNVGMTTHPEEPKVQSAVQLSDQVNAKQEAKVTPATIAVPLQSPTAEGLDALQAPVGAVAARNGASR